jgi:hypothetical protein
MSRGSFRRLRKPKKATIIGLDEIQPENDRIPRAYQKEP